jgi:hypothetical protein
MGLVQGKEEGRQKEEKDKNKLNISMRRERKEEM